ncbi:MAG: sigma-70 family RNA polymerase sigma factor [Solirubrobacterales bacterium]
MQGSGRLGRTSIATVLGVPGERHRTMRLSRRAVRGEDAAFEEIFRRHHQELYRYCLAILRDRDDAEDALQATMAAALRSLPGEEREIDLRPWLFRVAHNESISILRRSRDAAEVDGELADTAAASQDDALATRERLRRLVADLGRLPERQRSAIVMRELSGLSYEEIAAVVGCGEGNARQAVYEARTALRELEEARSMECEPIRRAISDRDGRRLRGRRIRAHLDGCDGCRAFAASIESRRADLDLLFPPLPAAAAGTILTGLAGSGAAGGGAGAGAAGVAAAGGGIATSAAIKGASLAAAVALAAGAADFGGLIDLPGPAGGGSKEGSAGSRTEPDASAGSVGAAPVPANASQGGSGAPADRSDGRSGGGSNRSDEGGSGAGRPHGDGKNAVPESSGGTGGAGSAPATSPSTPAANGNGNGGSSATAPGQTGANPGGGTSTAPGQTGEAGSSATAPGHGGGTPGNSAAAPGQAGSTPAATGTAGANANPNANGGSSSK